MAIAPMQMTGDCSGIARFEGMPVMVIGHQKAVM